jgi:hypothetical protein
MDVLFHDYFFAPLFLPFDCAGLGAGTGPGLGGTKFLTDASGATQYDCPSSD